MGSTAVGRAFDTLSNDPLRVIAAVGTGGISEVIGAVDRDITSKRNQVHDAKAKAERDADTAMKEQEEIKRKGKLTEQRNAQLAKVRAKGAMAGGRSSTILTDPAMSSGGAPSIYGGRKTLLGS